MKRRRINKKQVESYGAEYFTITISASNIKGQKGGDIVERNAFLLLWGSQLFMALLPFSGHNGSLKKKKMDITTLVWGFGQGQFNRMAGGLAETRDCKLCLPPYTMNTEP